jgi:hypothetical protein
MRKGFIGCRVEARAPQDLEQGMKPLSITLVLFGLLALIQPAHQLDLPGALLGMNSTHAGYARHRRQRRSTT